MAKKIGDKLCQSNFDKRLSDFGYLISTVQKVHTFCRFGYLEKTISRKFEQVGL